MLDKYSISVENLINLELAIDSFDSDLDILKMIKREIERISFVKSSKKFKQIYSFMKSQESFREVNQISKNWGNSTILCEVRLNNFIYRIIKLDNFMYLSNKARYVLLKFSIEELERFLSEEYLKLAKLNKTTYFNRILYLYFEEEFIQDCFNKINF